MTLKSNRNSKGGYSLLELTVVLIIATILATAAVPQFVNGYLVKAANKTALDMSAIEEASRAYYIANNNWPANITALQNSTPNYLPSSSTWNGINPFGASSATPSNYSYNVAPSGSTNGAPLIISTLVTNTQAQNIIENLLPLAGVNKSTNILSMSVSVPGSQASGALPSGSIVAWPGATAPTGFLMCDGTIYNSASYPNLAPVLGSTFGGNGTTTFGVPDFRGRLIVGLNTIAVNDGTDRIWSTDNYSNNLGQAASYHVNLIGGISGEEKHRQTLIEMAPHTHSFASWDYVKGFSGNSTTSPRDPQGGTTGSAGGNGDGTGLGAAANVVPPSMTMSYIIKT
jgi:prepilin-type N-terminal cleavage/methylation domain-containing protein